jgi:hypothetical protein
MWTVQITIFYEGGAHETRWIAHTHYTSYYLTMVRSDAQQFQVIRQAANAVGAISPQLSSVISAPILGVQISTSKTER